MNQFKIPKRMGVEQLMESETASFNNNPTGKNPNTKYIVLTLIVITCIGVGMYIANQYQKPEKNLKNGNEEN